MQEVNPMVPDGDVIVHDTEGTDCICGPTLEPIKKKDGVINWLVIHHSLNGKEKNEPK